MAGAGAAREVIDRMAGATPARSSAPARDAVRPGDDRVGVDRTRERIMTATIAQCEEFGMRRTTMEDVARRAGLGRATLYRYFPNKDALVQAIILAEAERFFRSVDGALAGLAGSDERLVEGFAFALDYVRSHALLGRLLRTEPESLLPYLLGDAQLIEVASAAVARRIAGTGGRAAPQPDDVRATAELAVRLVLSLALSPGSVLEVHDADGARALVRTYLVPGLRLSPPRAADRRAAAGRRRTAGSAPRARR